ARNSTPKRLRDGLACGDLQLDGPRLEKPQLRLVIEREFKCLGRPEQVGSPDRRARRPPNLRIAQQAWRLRPLDHFERLAVDCVALAKRGNSFEVLAAPGNRANDDPRLVTGLGVSCRDNP